MNVVDYILIFPELNSEKYLTELKPDVYVKGGDYNAETINQDERKIVEEYGGSIFIAPHIEGKSSSKIRFIILFIADPKTMLDKSSLR